MRQVARRAVGLAVLVATLASGAGTAWALGPDELLLIVNKNEPEGRKLAERYAGARHVPEGRILELGLPVADDISFEQYEREVVPGVRRFLEENGLAGRVKCLVMFHGVPLRVAARPGPSEEERKELAHLQAEITEARRQIEPIVIEFERLAKKVDPGFESQITGGGSMDAPRRAEVAARVVSQRLEGMTDAAARRETQGALLKILEQLAGPNTVTVYLAQRELGKAGVGPEERERWEKLLTFVKRSREQVRQLGAARYDAAARKRAREMAKEGFGLMEYAVIVQGQLEYLRPGGERTDTTACFDNEIALLWWDLYPRAAFFPNPLHHASVLTGTPPTLMTARLDATVVKTVDAMLADSIRAEREGLDGRFVVDSQGVAAGRDAYAAFDRQLKELADIVKGKSSLSLFYDERKEVLPPNSAENVALYVGWYSVQRYVPGMKFVPGAVGYHVASFEMKSLRAPGGGWVANLLQDGVAASLGPVAEPYLTAFPNPQEFFPLLMTGKLTLAEVYWRTLPHVSWMMGLVGDPLYRPFEKKPGMRVEDLPGDSLKGVVGKPVVVLPTTRGVAER